MAKILMMVVGLWAGISAVLFFLAKANNRPTVPEEILSEGFYYAAIAYAVYHMLTRNRRNSGNSDAPVTHNANPPESPAGNASEKSDL